MTENTFVSYTRSLSKPEVSEINNLMPNMTKANMPFQIEILR